MDASFNGYVENTSKQNVGMCEGCSITTKDFAKDNPNLNISIFQGTMGKNP